MEKNLNNLDAIIYDMTCFSGNKRERVEKTLLDAKYLYDKALGGISGINQVDTVQFLFKSEIAQPMLADEGRMVQMIKILLDNGVNFKDTSKGTCWVKTTFYEKEDAYLFTVKDNGIGIAPEEGDKIFQMFYRGSNKSNGSGLGLYLLKEITKKLNGKVSYTSVQGEGSEFNVEIPK